MRKPMLYLSVMIGSALLAGSAWAAPAARPSGPKDVYTIQGSVASVQPSAHRLTIDTDRGQMVLLLSPGAVFDDENQEQPVHRLAELHPGDEVRVEYVSEKAHEGGREQLMGRHVTRRKIENVHGTVASIDTWDRTLSVKTDRGVEAYKVDPSSRIFEVRGAKRDTVPLKEVTPGEHVKVQYCNRGDERILRRATIERPT